MDRREFTAFFAASGLGGALLPGVLWGIVQGQERVTREMVERAEKIAGLEFTDEQRERIARGLSSNLRAIEQLREVKLPNEVPPALRFNPVLPGMRLRMLQREMRRTQPAVQRPERLEDVAFWPVTHLAELVRTRQVMPSELVKMYLARIRRFDPQLHAVVTLTEERALEQAARLDADLRNGIWHGPLHGIPWGAKDLLAARGYPTTWGASPYREQMIDDDATVVERLDGAGAVLIAKLTLGALAQGDRWFGGMTRNPWAPAEGSSGSSAGPGAATAAGLVGFSIGTETLGSIVSPAARNGVTGLRPTFGHGAMALSWSMDKIGPMCRTVEDCALVLDAICGPDERDPTVRAVPFSWDAERPLSSLRVGYDRLGFEQADPAGERNAFDQAALAALRALIPNLEPVTLPTRDYPLDAIRATVLGVEAAAAFDELTRSGRDALLDAEPERSAWPNTFRTARFVSAVEYINANRVRTLVMDAMDRALGNIDVIISPAVSALLLTNLTGHPQIALPAGFTQRNGTDVPVTITFIGRLYDEDRLLTVAKAWQDATGHHLRRPPVFS
jgi:Asp-tRNA(Asn)/Glu-tRNA(Gln) amidotransferase A subunit family amidase/Asp-tRNA(Asn)/Glu-tRNA(Gln) amidotransferase C subunit